MTRSIGLQAPLPVPAEERRRRLRTRLVRGVMLLPALLLLAFFFVSIGRMIAMTVVDSNGLTLALYREFIARPDYLGIYVRTIVVSLAVTALSIVAGYPIAYGIWRYPGNRNILMILVILPWLVSIVVRTYGWIVILGPRGLVNEWLKWAGVIESPIRLMFNTTGVIIGLVHVLMPFMIISVLTVLLHLDKSLDEASKSLGARPWYGFCRVTLPLSLPGIVSGAILVFLMSTGAIVTPILLGGVQDRMVGTQIYQEAIQTFNFPKASMLAFLLLLSGVAVALPLQWLERRLTAWSRSRRTAS
ncbi:ABC transporter permease [Bradyrhizobium sp. U87765 SZCCT0131]|uniref:ABC transporter permease n=1 Tax=unclassified Bradyrhizobium TaxID=2631580 RepID=UPI001BA925B6|nr:MULTISPECIES: ABC transporter permease [unclassified Bradyrhizobium]MBR1217223.1 ABC transporter permease [Bradyrhizobium sp. U87765 SZCCT0131]MBR1259021.1 ABC transporter permease [Bradyrhizobium sp. U87765 SZCCT0134]MBR1305162.1 ABC transporter permease [Bradyrhizobium sp. U87765 SZCCT0110]MBR1320948.1 ABC transporter permease [Bradyrhizobium sp. U87765 SZCCT0109]MBR1350398.1 ABC transporter permease [Bradyrhizobium sp. U87765 SZCCT0048]